MEQKQYDVIIIGGGPCGYTAALYCARAALSCLVIEQLSPGGQMGTTDTIENYPGFPSGINGFELAMQMKQGAERFGVETCMETVERVELQGPVKRVYTRQEEYEAGAVILAMGASPRELDLPNEKSLRGKGVSYCATCDGMLYRGKTVVVVGGGDTAAADAVFLSKICRKVYLVHRRDTLRASKAYLAPLNSCGNIEFIWDSTVEEILASEKVTAVAIKNIKNGAYQMIDCDGVFVAIGNTPNTDLVRGQVTLNDRGYVMADETTRTNIPGVFAAGDLREKPLRQVVTAVADGAVAASFVEEYLTQRG